jgi:hypothetical protein
VNSTANGTIGLNLRGCAQRLFGEGFEFAAYPLPNLFDFWQGSLTLPNLFAFGRP